jgi:hypothetical protein
MVTSTAENCLGSECPFWEECFVVQARQRAQSADIVVVNHHLLLADLALKQEGFGEILPGAQAFVIDEAHQLPELAANFFGESFGMRQLQELARDCLAECADVPGALAALQPAVRALEQALRELRAGMEGLPARGTRQRALDSAKCAPAFEMLQAALAQLRDSAAPLADASTRIGRLRGARQGQRDAAVALAGHERPPMPIPMPDASSARDGAPLPRRRAVVRAQRARLPLPAHAAGRVRPAARAPRAFARRVGVHLRDARRRRRLPAPRRAAGDCRIRPPCSSPARSTGRARRCATCRRTCPSPARAATAPR